ncbi:hypothetical protein B0H11DRAFT_711521 [Mycena galericulata]|nr:hypothetical protein B0H11DRAFT_711521 [Mycena galericulata]
MVIQFASAARELLSQDRGGCKLDTAQVCLRSTNSNAINGPSFVLAHFDPSHFYKPSASSQKMMADGWEVFVNLITKAIVGSFSRPNYVVGQHGNTGPIVTKTFRFLIHFLVDFRYHQDRQHDGLDQTFRKLGLDMKSLQDDVENLASEHSSNPLLDSMQRYSSSLCAIWDLWSLIPVEPGDLGIMIPGDDPKRPRFQKITNVAVNIHEWLGANTQTIPIVTSYPDYAEHQYVPSDGTCWSSERVNASTMRHSLRMGNAPTSTLKFVFSRARKITLMGNSWDYNGSWSYLRHMRATGELQALATAHSIASEDLMLIFSSSQSEGYTHLIFKSTERRKALPGDVGATDGCLYYFENLLAVEGELCGYWSASENPGNPLWGGVARAEGPEWGWEHSDGDFKVEIGRKGPVQHIRYVSL